MKIQASFIANLFEYASYKGISERGLRNCLSDKEINVCDPNHAITQKEYLSVLETLLNLSNDKYFGIHYGCYLNIKALGLIAQLSLNASSIRQAVFILQSYIKNTFPFVNLTNSLINGKYVLSLTGSVSNKIIQEHIVDFTYCFIYRELTLMLPANSLPILEAPGNKAAELSAFLRTKISKGKQHKFHFDARILETPINLKRVKEIEILLPKFLQMLNERKTGYKIFSNKVRNVVLNMCCPEPPTFKQVATSFPLSNRAIQRKLAEEGLSFRKIVDDVKMELAGFLITGNKIKTQEIANILGYSESSAYLHAAKKWKAKLPL